MPKYGYFVGGDVALERKIPFFGSFVLQTAGMFASLLLVSLFSLSITSSTVDPLIATSSFNDVYYAQKIVGSNTEGYFLLNSDGGVPTRSNFWTSAEMIEMIEDAWDRNPNAELQEQVRELLDGLNGIVSGTPDFTTWNIYNDDVTWAVLALTRGYAITRRVEYLQQVSDAVQK